MILSVFQTSDLPPPWASMRPPWQPPCASITTPQSRITRAIGRRTASGRPSGRHGGQRGRISPSPGKALQAFGTKNQPTPMIASSRPRNRRSLLTEPRYRPPATQPERRSWRPVTPAVRVASRTPGGAQGSPPSTPERRTTMARCNLCDEPVDLENLHPDSLPIPPAGAERWSVTHMGCTALQDGETDRAVLDDARAWITTY